MFLFPILVRDFALVYSKSFFVDVQVGDAIFVNCVYNLN